MADGYGYYNEDYVDVYTDGACENNGRANARAGIGVWFGDGHPSNISRPVYGRPTNNTAEIQACTEALRTVRDQGGTRVNIHTDSQFTKNCMTKWVHNWKQNDWKTTNNTDVKNKADLQELDKVMGSFEDVKWTHVPSHSGVRGNEQADKLAREGAQRYRKY